MTDSAVTLGSIFAFTESAVEHGLSNRWGVLGERIMGEIKGIKWNGAVPDITRKVSELFDIEVPDVLVVAWKKAQNIQKVIGESRRSPGETMYIELADHTIRSEQHPYIEIKVEDVMVKKIEFETQLTFALKGFILKIQAGEIKEIRTGTCEIEGVVQYAGQTIAEKKLEQIQLPGSLIIHERSGVEDDSGA
jgi:hypothetical protein